MGKTTEILRSAIRGSRLIFLLAFLFVTAFHGLWSYQRFHLSAPLWLVPLWSMPWWYWATPLIDAAPRHLQLTLHAVAMATGFAFNTCVAYTLVRAFILAQRPNNSFKPSPLRGLGRAS